MDTASRKTNLNVLATALTNLSLIDEFRMVNGDHNSTIVYYSASEEAEQENNDLIIDNWESLFNFSVYDDKKEDKEINADFSGWASVITGEDIPIADMKRWRSWILNKITTLRPQQVLEIGIGSGLIMYPLLHQVKKFVGLDLSQAVVERHLSYLSNDTSDVSLYHLRADQINELPKDLHFDTIIINSVCQYFPNVMYFEEVIGKALSRLKNHGSIFLGDVRNFELHREFVEEKLIFEKREIDDVLVHKIMLEEDELLLSPIYLQEFGKRIAGCEVEVLTRPATFEKELSRYRYDAIFTKHEATEVLKEKVHTMTHEQVSQIKDLYNTPFLSQLKPDHITSQIDAALLASLQPIQFVAVNSFLGLDERPLDIISYSPLDDLAQTESNSFSSGNYEKAKVDLSDLDFDF